MNFAIQALAPSDLLANVDDGGELRLRLSQAEAQLLQAERLASVGQLAAGVAHEINNPIGYVQSNIGSLQSYVDDLMQVIEAYESVERLLPDEHPTVRSLRAVKADHQIDFLKSDICALLAETREGIGRVRRIVQDLKDFSRVDQEQTWEWADLHAGIESTLNIVANELRYRATVVKAFGELPPVQCLPSQLNQVFLNLLVNAGHAIGDDRGTITIATGTERDEAWVSVTDTGCGIPPHNLARIFDPFFTTKKVGQGTGLGLSLSYGIVKKHQGRLEVTSREGVGTTFRVCIPLAQPGEAEPAR